MVPIGVWDDKHARSDFHVDNTTQWGAKLGEAGRRMVNRAILILAGTGALTNQISEVVTDLLVQQISLSVRIAVVV